MTTVVTGAAGHLGGNLVRALLARGRTVRALDYTRDWRPLAGLGVETVEGDIRDLAFLQRALAGAGVVYHTAAYISLRMNEGPLVESINVEGTRNVVRACLDNGVRRLVHFSSIHALRQEPSGVPVDESSPLVSSGSPYDRSKAAGQREVQKAIADGLDAVILNPTGIIGPHDYRPSFLGRALLALAQRRLPALVNSGFDWVDVRDVVDAALRTEEMAAPGARYVVSGHWVSLRDLASLIEEITAARAPRLICPMWLARAAAAVSDALVRPASPIFTRLSMRELRSNRHISHQRAARELGYHPRPLRETLSDLFAWFQQAGLLASGPAG
jgi:dihydroflavonol-4-reductase